MTYLRFDSDTAWFIAAVIVILLLSALAGYISAKMTIADNCRKRLRAKEALRMANWRRVMADLEIPTYQREANHPLDRDPYDLRTIVHPEPIEISDWRKIN
jgi:hypothetical protein